MYTYTTPQKKIKESKKESLSPKPRIISYTTPFFKNQCWLLPVGATEFTVQSNSVLY